MKTFITIIAASAALSASLVAGLAASDSTHAPGSAVASGNVTAVPAPKAAPVAGTTWSDPPAKVDTACRDAAWPYRPTLCAPRTEGGARKVRVIASGAPVALAPAQR